MDFGHAEIELEDDDDEAEDRQPDDGPASGAGADDDEPEGKGKGDGAGGAAAGAEGEAVDGDDDSAAPGGAAAAAAPEADVDERAARRQRAQELAKQAKEALAGKRALAKKHRQMRGGSRSAVAAQIDIAGSCEVAVSSNEARKRHVTDAATDTFWEPSGGDSKRAVDFRPNEVAVRDLVGMPDGVSPELACVLVAVDTSRDENNAPSEVQLHLGESAAKLKQVASVKVPPKFCGWLALAFAKTTHMSAAMGLSAGGWNLPGAAGSGEAGVSEAASRSFAKSLRCALPTMLRVSVKTGKGHPRIRGVQIMCTSVPKIPVADSIRESALSTFRSLAERVFGSLQAPGVQVDEEGNVDHGDDGYDAGGRQQELAMQAIASPQFAKDASDVRHRVASLLFGVHGSAEALAPARAALSGMQHNVFNLVAGEVEMEAQRLGSIAAAAVRQAGRGQRSATAGAEALKTASSPAQEAHMFEMVEMLHALVGTKPG